MLQWSHGEKPLLASAS
uniref:Uncharacterized protein n=1 Tax=Medicago truncatula TaxID=3880 RepID=I3S3W1_MEDTR|nr:unknown [Medicago truncatula]